ncbi:MAG: hypothetical protein ACFCUX_10205 [Candidatus Methylacidiphilales bacterium]
MLCPPKARAAEPPANPHLAQSSWPIYHANTHATASVWSTAVVDPTSFETVENLTHRRIRSGQVSPWTVLRAPEPDGTQVILTTPLNGIAKYAIQNGRLRQVHFLQIERKWTDIDWGILILADGSAVVTERLHNRFAVIGDSTQDPTSPLKVLRRLSIDTPQYGGLTSHFTLAHDGSIIAYTQKPAIIAVDPLSGRVLASHPLSKEYGSASHNSFPIDERGRLYLLGQRAMTAIDWDGSTFTPAWTSPYNMRGPGFEQVREDRRPIVDAIAVARGKPGTGSGTTPSLIGNPETGIVVVVDGHSPKNNLVAFWRGDIPTDWKPLPDPNTPGTFLDRRVAGVLPLPHSTPEGDGHTAENSPAVLGNAIVVAQWAGFRPGATPPKGVQRVDWNPSQRQLKLIWANPDVHLNGVPTIGKGPDSPRVFGMGREGEHYVYSVLSLADGTRLRRMDLGRSDAVLDQGNNHVIAADGSIIYGGSKKLVRLYRP